MSEIFNREMLKEKNLDAIRKLQELDKKKIPKDQTLAKKKAEEKKAEMLKTADDNFAKLLESIKNEKPEQNGHAEGEADKAGEEAPQH
jgi:dynein intermediate chain 2